MSKAAAAGVQSSGMGMRSRMNAFKSTTKKTMSAQQSKMNFVSDSEQVT